MPYLSSVTDLETFLGRSVELNRATQALDFAEASIVDDLGWDPVQTTRTVSFVDTSVLFLPAAYVTAVSAVSTTGAALTVTFTESGVVYLPYRSSGTVTYTAGWTSANVPTGIRAEIVERAARSLDNPRGLRSWSLGDESETYAGPAGETPSPTRLSRYALPVLA